MELPVIFGDNKSYPDKPVCPICKKNKVFEPHSFSFISGGALIQEKSKYNKYSAYSVLEAFLNIGWHGSHPKDGGEGEDSELYIHLP